MRDVWSYLFEANTLTNFKSPKWIGVFSFCRCSVVLPGGGRSGGATGSPAELHRQLSRDHE